ncbi:hypothetical protein BCR37DRAFT_394947 [Protomyces lactucae-debilis]|uniref:Uncharacterized protein n=1 Tax=Protomyces lactucae-debilis TaxID=2754530 RepID=A0A1Y2F0F2_PROLT|nr:uncharacterized protein BCR37DRAFT_394947 [Protomyces lactucae-debilis]ORY77320.1 hypothetical protein BCR37DRAFT_394947 [Protomyces lactucae-debilis]
MQVSYTTPIAGPSDIQATNNNTTKDARPGLKQIESASCSWTISLGTGPAGPCTAHESALRSTLRSPPLHQTPPALHPKPESTPLATSALTRPDEQRPVHGYLADASQPAKTRSEPTWHGGLLGACHASAWLQAETKGSYTHLAGYLLDMHDNVDEQEREMWSRELLQQTDTRNQQACLSASPVPPAPTPYWPTPALTPATHVFPTGRGKKRKVEDAKSWPYPPDRCRSSGQLEWQNARMASLRLAMEVDCRGSVSGAPGAALGLYASPQFDE